MSGKMKLLKMLLSDSKKVTNPLRSRQARSDITEFIDTLEAADNAAFILRSSSLAYSRQEIYT